MLSTRQAVEGGGGEKKLGLLFHELATRFFVGLVGFPRCIIVCIGTQIREGGFKFFPFYVSRVTSKLGPSS